MSIPLRLIVLGSWALGTIFCLLFVTSERAGKPRRTFFFKLFASLTYLGYAVALIAYTGDTQTNVLLVLGALCFSFLADLTSSAVSQLRLRGPNHYKRIRPALGILTGLLFIGHIVCLGLAFYRGMMDAGIDPGWRFWVIMLLPIPPIIALDITLDLKLMNRLVHAPLLVLPILVLVVAFFLSASAIMEYGVLRMAYDPFGGLSAVLGILFYIYDTLLFAIRGTDNKLYKSYRVWAIAYVFYYIAQLSLAGSLIAFGGFGNLLLK